MVSVKGDFSELAQLSEKLEQISGDEFRRESVQRLAEEARTQVLLGFEQSRDPYGNPWKPPVTRPGGKPLLDKGRLRNSINVKSNQSGFIVSTDVSYAATHQYGATIKAKTPGKPLKFRVGKSGWRSKYSVTIPRRQFMPENYLGPIWSEALGLEADRILAEYLA